MATYVFNTAVEEGVKERLTEVETAYAQVERHWKLAASEAVKSADLSAQGRRLAGGRVLVRQEELQRAGLLLGTRTALLSLWLRRVLAQANEGLDWPAIPDGVASLPGRRWGVRPRVGDGFPDRLNVRVAPELFQTVRRAAYWLSAPAEEALQKWSDRHGPGPAAGGWALLAAALRGFPSAAEMQARDDARAEIITTGMILREAVWRAIGEGPPEETLLQNLQDNAERSGKEAGTRIAHDMAIEEAQVARASRATAKG
jgi:hypothetical protein